MSLTPDSFSSDSPEEKREEEHASEEVAAPSLRAPTEAGYETNGGPLGCCLGTVVGVLLTALLITFLSVSFSNGAIFGPVTLPVVLAGAAVCGYLGWRIGKHVYREYELSPRQQRKLAQLEKKYGPERAQR